MTILAGNPTTTTPFTVPRFETPPTVCRCGGRVRVSYVAAGDRVVPGLWQCTGCGAGRRAWPPDPDYRCD